MFSKYLCQFGLVYFGFGSFYGPAQANQGFLLLLAALLIGGLVKFRNLVKTRVGLTSLLFMGYVLLRGCAAALGQPGESERVLEYTADWLMLGLLPALLVAAAVRVSGFQPHHLLGLALAGFLFKVGLRIDWSAPFAFFEKFFTEEFTRASFGYSVINLPLWTLFFIIGLIIYSEEYIRDRSRPRMLLRALAWLIVISLLIFLVVISKTRSVWILSCLVIPICVFFKCFETVRIRRSIAGLAAAAILLVPILLVASNRTFFVERLTAEQAVVRQLLTTEAEDIPPTSIGMRYYMYRVFVEQAPERPVLGWGPGQTERLLHASGYPGLDQMPHFHNIFAELMLQLGLVGLLLFGAMFAVLFHAALGVRHSLFHKGRFRWFLSCSALVFCAVGMINHTLWSTATPYFFSLMGGMAYAPLAQRYCTLPPGRQPGGEIS